MTFRQGLAFAVVAVACLSTVSAQQGASAERQYQAALHTEMVDRDPRTAIDQYKLVVASGDRALAAQALLRIAGCYEKLGDAEAQEIYAQILRDFADQAAVVAEARTRLIAPAAAGARGKAAALRQVWTTADKLWVTGSVSADGRKVAYLSIRTGDLAVHDLATGSNRVVVLGDQDGSRPLFSSAFSRDGRRLAYQASVGPEAAHKYQLRTVDLGGDPGVPRSKVLLDAEAIPYDWTPDGKWIAVRLTKDSETQAIGLVSTDDGSLRILKTFAWRARTIFRVIRTSLMRAEFNGFLSPDGSQLAVELLEDASGARDIVVLPVDGSPEIPAVRVKGDDRLMGWSPDGLSIVFTNERSGATAIWRQRLQGGRLQGDPELVRRSFIQSDSMGLTPAGALYSVVRSQPYNNGSVKEASLDFDTGTFLAAPSDAAETFIQSNVAPRWSPDGTRLAYFSYRGINGDNKVLVIRSLATGEARELPITFFFRGDNHNLWDWIDNQSIVAVGEDANARTGFHRSTSIVPAPRTRPGRKKR